MVVIAASTVVDTARGNGRFVSAKVRQFRMKGNSFVWTFKGAAAEPGSHFEIRAKGDACLKPATPRGVEAIHAEALDHLPKKIYEYGVWQVLADGREEELEDPELEIIYA